MRTRVVRRTCTALGLLLLFCAPRTAPASVAEQRARLPPPARCEDPVVGEWRAHMYHERYGFWGVYTLFIKHKPGSDSELVGTMTSEFWDGTKADAEPGNCGPTVPYRTRVIENAVGGFKGNDVHFDGLDWKLDKVICGHMPTGLGYNPDHFSGTIDPAIQEFQSVNNDGGIAVNEPVVFRRIKCGDEPVAGPEPRVPAIEPPPFFPPVRSGC